MEVQEGHKGQGRAHSLICSLGEFEREHEDEVGGWSSGNIGHFYPWRQPASLGPHLFGRVVLPWRRAHHQQGGLSKLSLQ
jgi:hypothetical protein